MFLCAYVFKTLYSMLLLILMLLHKHQVPHPPIRRVKTNNLICLVPGEIEIAQHVGRETIRFYRQ